MWRAVILERGDGRRSLGAPTVGRWEHALRDGVILGPGDLLGRLRRDGRWVEVRVPEDGVGPASPTVRSGSWVAYGQEVVVLGAVEAAARVAAPVAVASGAGVPACAETDGTVYLSPQPGTPPFAPVGALVAAHDVVALVEVMKTFTPVRAPVGGRVASVCVPHAAPVAAGDVLLLIEP